MCRFCSTGGPKYRRQKFDQSLGGRLPVEPNVHLPAMRSLSTYEPSEIEVETIAGKRGIGNVRSAACARQNLKTPRASLPASDRASRGRHPAHRPDGFQRTAYCAMRHVDKHRDGARP
jgi:hypothetical protein